MPGAKPRQKGDRVERRVVKLLETAGIKAQRVPCSGAAGGKFGDDVRLTVGVNELKAEVKGRAKAAGWVTVKTWLKDNDLLFLVEDGKMPLVVEPFKNWTARVKAAVLAEELGEVADGQANDIEELEKELERTTDDLRAANEEIQRLRYPLGQVPEPGLPGEQEERLPRGPGPSVGGEAPGEDLSRPFGVI